MNLPYILLQVSELTEGARRMEAIDPHGWTLTLIAVTVVFSALVVLFGIFSLIGKMSIKMDAGTAVPETPKAPKAIKGGKVPDGEVAAAIAMALEAENGGEVPVAIATALSLYIGNGIHDVEPGFLTMNTSSGPWADKSLSFRKNPKK